MSATHLRGVFPGQQDEPVAVSRHEIEIVDRRHARFPLVDQPVDEIHRS